MNIEQISDYMMNLENSNFPFFVSNGFLFYYNKQTKSIKGANLVSHYWLNNWREDKDSEDSHKKYFMQNLQINNFDRCFLAANYMSDQNKGKYLDLLGKESLKALKIDIAEEAFRLNHNSSLVMLINSFKNEYEKAILFGNIAAIIGDETMAQDFFKTSTKPELALELRCDLQDWNIALRLAREYKPYMEKLISRRLAYQYESQSNPSEAIKLYEESFVHNVDAFIKESNFEADYIEVTDHNSLCRTGIARCSFKLGDNDKGMKLALELDDKQNLIEIANLCESMKFNLEAAKLYQNVGMYEKAAKLYIMLKHFKSAEALIDKILSPNLLIQLAKMKEMEKLYDEAERTYEKAGDWESVVKINLKYLDNPNKAQEICKKHLDPDKANDLIRKYYEFKGNKKEQIVFTCMSKKYEEAFALAQGYNEMETYAGWMLQNTNIKEEFNKIAIYYEGKNEFGNSGIFNEKAGNHGKALKMYIKSESEDYLEKAVEMVSGQTDENLIDELIDYLLGSSKLEKGPHFLLKLYILQKDVQKCTNFAVTITDQEMELANFQYAKFMLFDVYKELKAKDLPVSYEINKRLAILQSYYLSKFYIKKGNHYLTAKNLLRVGSHINMFEKHKVEIMTSICIMCDEAGLISKSVNYAIELYNKEYREKIPDVIC